MEVFFKKGVNMTHPSGKEWLVKYGQRAHFQNPRGYFTTRWTAFAIDNELKVDNEFLFTITSPSSILVKVFGIVKTMLSVDDKVNKGDYENDTEEEDIIDDKDYKEKDKDDEDDDDDDKVIKLASKNEEHFYQKDDSMVLINYDEYEDMKKYPRAKPYGCINTSIDKISQNLMVVTKFVNYNTSVIQTQLNRL
jgi:hypothetical protein